MKATDTVVLNGGPFPGVLVPCLGCGATKPSAIMVRTERGITNLCAACLVQALLAGLAERECPDPERNP